MIKVSKTVRDGSVRITFALPAAEPAGAVSVVGDFNNWDPFAHPLRKRSNGTRSTVVTASPGSTLRFRYLAEGATGSTTRRPTRWTVRARPSRCELSPATG